MVDLLKSSVTLLPRSCRSEAECGVDEECSAEVEAAASVELLRSCSTEDSNGTPVSNVDGSVIDGR